MTASTASVKRRLIVIRKTRKTLRNLQVLMTRMEKAVALPNV